VVRIYTTIRCHNSYNLLDCERKKGIKMENTKSKHSFTKGVVAGILLFTFVVALIYYMTILTSTAPKALYLYDQFKNNCINENNKFVEGANSNGYCVVNGIKQTYIDYIKLQFGYFSKACTDGTIGDNKLIQTPDCGELCAMETSTCGTTTFKDFISKKVL
jgi:hypothetical protein